MKALRLELVPKPLWGINLRSLLPKEWPTISKTHRVRANGRCEVCLRPTPFQQLNCHEVWEYEDKTSTQVLVGLEAVCTMCHDAKHYGRTQTVHSRLYCAKVLEHLSNVNVWTETQIERHIRDAMAKWRHRSKRPWKQDISWIYEVWEAA